MLSAARSSEKYTGIARHQATVVQGMLREANLSEENFSEIARQLVSCGLPSAMEATMLADLAGGGCVKDGTL